MKTSLDNQEELKAGSANAIKTAAEDETNYHDYIEQEDWR